MQKTLHDHILYLEERVQVLLAELTAPRRFARERERIEAELHAAETALAHYRTAIDLEQSMK